METDITQHHYLQNNPKYTRQPYYLVTDDMAVFCYAKLFHNVFVIKIIDKTDINIYNKIQQIYKKGEKTWRLLCRQGRMWELQRR